MNGWEKQWGSVVIGRNGDQWFVMGTKMTSDWSVERMMIRECLLGTNVISDWSLGTMAISYWSVEKVMIREWS